VARWYEDEKLEEILKNYPLLKAQARLEAEELRHLFPSCTMRYDGVLPGGGLTDRTGDYAVLREQWSQSMKQARAIEVACEALNSQERELIRLLYFERWGRYQIRLQMGVQRSSLFNIRRDALDKLAALLFA
jgi:hypothetical protein